MKKAFILSICLAMFFPAILAAQKAYDITYYKATFKGEPLVLSLANGYVAASKITSRNKLTKRARLYRPASGKTDSKGRLRFTSTALARQYFVLNGLQEVFEILPATIKGIFVTGGKTYRIVFFIYREPTTQQRQ